MRKYSWIDTLRNPRRWVSVKVARWFKLIHYHTTIERCHVHVQAKGQVTLPAEVRRRLDSVPACVGEMADRWDMGEWPRLPSGCDTC